MVRWSAHPAQSTGKLWGMFSGGLAVPCSPCTVFALFQQSAHTSKPAPLKTRIQTCHHAAQEWEFLSRIPTFATGILPLPHIPPPPKRFCWQQSSRGECR